MLDIEEFQRKRERIFQDKENISNLAELKNYIQDLKIVSANEKSEEITNLVRDLISEIEGMAEKSTCFQLHWILFKQIYLYVKKIDETEILLNKMQSIVDETKDIEQTVKLMNAQSLLYQLKGDQRSSKERILESMKIIESYKKEYKEIYYETLYAYIVSLTFETKEYSSVIEELEECMQYYYSESKNVLGLIKVVYMLLRFYILSGRKEKVNELFDWILKKEKIQEKLSISNYTSLYWVLGMVASINFQINESIEFLSKVYKRITETESQEQMLYEYVEVLKLLSRSYAYKGNFQESYNLLIELLNFIDTDFCKQNYLVWRIKRVYFAIYYTLLFIFVQLDMQLKDVEDEKLEVVYEYIKTLLEESQFSENLLLNSSLSDKEMKKIARREYSQADEFHLIVHQQLSSIEAHKLSEDSVNKIKILRDYAHSPLYADILIGKIHLSMGNFDEFEQIVKKIMLHREDADTPILSSWIKLFELLNKFLLEKNTEDVVKELISLEKQCKQNNFHKMAEEVILYQKLITSTRTLENFRERFNQTAFIDIYNNQSKEMVMEYLETSSVE